MSEIEPTGRSAPAVALRHGRQRRYNGAGRAVGVVASALAVILVSGGLVGAATYSSIQKQIAAQAVVINDQPPPPPDLGAIEGGYNMLIVGSDTREGQNGYGGEDEGGVLNDVNILIHVAQDQSNAAVVSFPRDLQVPISGRCEDLWTYENKINTALSQGGLACAVATVEDFTGLPIQFAGLITFLGVVEMADAIGGVDVCINGPMYDPEVGLDLPEAGTYSLAGWEALAFLRSRHGVGDGSDLGRVSSQQVYLSSLVRKMKSGDTLKDPVKLFNLANKVIDLATRETPLMQISSSLADPYMIAQIALSLKNIPLERVLFIQYPGAGIVEGNVIPDHSVADPMFDLIRADQPFVLEAVGDDRGSTIDPNAPPVEVDNEGLPVMAGVSGQSAADYSCTVVN